MAWLQIEWVSTLFDDVLSSPLTLTTLVSLGKESPSCHWPGSVLPGSTVSFLLKIPMKEVHDKSHYVGNQYIYWCQTVRTCQPLDWGWCWWYWGCTVCDAVLLCCSSPVTRSGWILLTVSPLGSEVIKTSPSQSSPAQCLEMRQKLLSTITTVTQPFFTLLIKIPMTGPKHTGAWNIRPDSFQDVHLNCCSPGGGWGGLIWDQVPGCKDPRR